MMNIHYLFLLLFSWSANNFSVPTKFVGRTGHLHVESHSRFLDIIADNYQIYSVIHPATGEVDVKGLTKSFEFKLGALDQAFNSDRFDMSDYAKFRYEGNITNSASINWTQPGIYQIEVSGILYMGGYQRKTPAQGKLFIQDDGSIRAETSFIMTIEEESMNTINKLMKEKLPSVVALDAQKLGISRDIILDLKTNLRPRR